MDSRASTLLHSQRVGELIVEVVRELLDRSQRHDRSKTESPEVEVFDAETERLGSLVYGSPEYGDALQRLGPALEHHYAENRHHPEHFPAGVSDMNLVDLIEMLADWRAATERVSAGDLASSLKLNAKRFDIGEQLARVLDNTCSDFGWVIGRERCPDCGNERGEPWRVVNPRWPAGGGAHRERCDNNEFHDGAGAAGRTEVEHAR